MKVQLGSNKASLEINIYYKLVNLLNKKGYKAGASRMLNYALFVISKKTGYSFSFLVWKIFRKMFTRVEARNISVKGKSHIVPFTVSSNRRVYLVTKWIVRAIKERKKKRGILPIIIEELSGLVLNKKSKILEYKEKNYKAVLANRSNLHFRW